MLDGRLLIDAHTHVARIPTLSADWQAWVRTFGAGIDRLLTVGDRVVGVAVGGDNVHAAEVVIASGAWAASWAEALKKPIPVRPVRGQMLALRAALDEIAVGVVLLDHDLRSQFINRAFRRMWSGISSATRTSR